MNFMSTHEPYQGYISKCNYKYTRQGNNLRRGINAPKTYVCP